MRFIKPKVELGLGKSTPQSIFKYLSSLCLGKMSKLCSLESISKMSKMLVWKQTCVRTLKEQVEKDLNALVREEAEQRRAHLHVNDRMVIHRDVKNDLDRVKENLENVLSSWEDLRFLRCQVLR